VILASLPLAASTLIHGCWRQDRDARPTFGEVVAALGGPAARAVD